MDGIFGIGFAELVIIALVLFVIGGPTNTVKWARELGRMVRKARELWREVITELEKDVPGTQEVVNTMADLSQNVREITAAPQRMVSDTLRIAEVSPSPKEELQTTTKAAAPPVSQVAASANGKRYAAWLPPEGLSKD
jgi:Sec-independent protein translocase protein TatA